MLDVMGRITKRMHWTAFSAACGLFARGQAVHHDFVFAWRNDASSATRYLAASMGKSPCAGRQKIATLTSDYNPIAQNTVTTSADPLRQRQAAPSENFAGGHFTRLHKPPWLARLVSSLDHAFHAANFQTSTVKAAASRCFLGVIVLRTDQSAWRASVMCRHDWVFDSVIGARAKAASRTTVGGSAGFVCVCGRVMCTLPLTGKRVPLTAKRVPLTAKRCWRSWVS